MRSRPTAIALLTMVVCAAWPAPAMAQPLGSFTWQLQPFCNRVTVNVRQDGAVYTLDGWEDQCGGAQKAPLVGLATVNPDGTIGFGLNIVSPTGQAIPVQARISMASLSGTWSDAGGNGGVFAFGANTGGSPRSNTPSTGGDITGVAAGAGLTGGGTGGDVTLTVDSSVVQSRVTTACPAGQALRSINQNGSAVCEPISGAGGGDVTAVNAGAGLTGGGTAGDVSLAVLFGGSGAAASAARSDHTHAVTGTDNTGAGVGALASVTSGVNNTALGRNALAAATTAGGNTAVGWNALAANALSSGNSAFGVEALTALTSGGGNAAFGTQALRSLATGIENTAFGFQALRLLSSGSNNLAIGEWAGSNLVSGGSNVYIATNGASTESNTLRIGRNAQTRAFIAGIRGVTTGVNNAVPVVIDSNGQLGTVSSSRRTKDNIADLGSVSRAILNLRPVQFTYKEPFGDGSTPVQFGLIAEEVEQVLPALVAYGADGQPETVKYHVLPTLLLAEIQRLERERAALASRLAEIERRLNAPGAPGVK